jgi:ATP-binding cassette subfamily B protein
MALARLIFGRQQFVLEKSIVPLQRKGYDLYGYTTLPAYAKESRLFGFTGYFMDLYRQLQDMILEKRNGLHYLFLKRSIFLTFFEVVMVTLFTLFVIRGSLTGAITLGSMLVYFQAFQRLQGSISSMFRSLISLYQHQLYLQEVMHFFSLEGRQAGPLPDSATDGGRPGIEVRNLSFRYPGTDRPVLQDVSMQLPGEGFVAIVGENGSGKSTLVKLICGLYAIEEGEILMEGNPVNSLPDEWFREKVSVLFQDFGHYYLTVAENVALGNPGPDPGRLQSSLDLATADGFVGNLRQGQQSILGRTHKNGEELSGGQWQKIAIARALYKKADILILDEPTSSMDPLSEHRFFEQLRQASGNRLVILITHRLYNLRMADYIYVFEEGRIGEAGSFDELVRKDGLFNRYYKTQKL